MKINYLNVSKGKIEVDIQMIKFPEKLHQGSNISYTKEPMKLINAAMLP